MKMLFDNVFMKMREIGSQSLYGFGKLFLKEHILYAPSKGHLEIYDLLLDVTKTRGRKVVIAAPRDFGKSTMITLIYVIYSICYKKEDFILIVSNTIPQATQIMENIRKELKENKKLQAAFPEVFGKTKDKLLCDSANQIVTYNGVKIIARGSGQQIRGIKHGASRPTLIIADDMEKSENTFSLASREKSKEWFSKTVLMTGSNTTNCIFIGNLYHPHCILGEYISPEGNLGWNKKIYKAIISWPTRTDLWATWSNIYNGREKHNNETGPEAAKKYYLEYTGNMNEGVELLWPQKHTIYELMLMKEENEFSFMSEMQNSPLNSKDIIFHPDNFQFWTDHYISKEKLLQDLGDNAEFYGACDPSLGSQNLKGDYSAIIVLACDKRDNILYLIEADIKRRTPDETINDILIYYARYKFHKFGVETNQFQKMMVTRLEEEGRKKGLYISLESINNTHDKIKRIQGLQPLVKNGTVKFSKHHTLLLEQARYFPKGKFDDGLDALEMAVRTAEEKPGKVEVMIVGGGRSWRDELREMMGPSSNF